jgi:D-cysteine desulfhydrase
MGVESALEIAQQCEGAVSLSSVVVASGSAGTRPGWRAGTTTPEELIGVTVSRSVEKPKVVTLQQAVAEQLELKAKADIVSGMTILRRAMARQMKRDGSGEIAGAPRRDPA